MMNETHDLNRQPTVERPWTDPHPYDMPPAERAAYANGAGAGRRESEAEIARLRIECGEAHSMVAAHEATIIKQETELVRLRTELDAALAKADRLRDAYEGVRALNLQINDTSIGLLRERDAAWAEIGLLIEHVRCVINERELVTDLLNTAREALNRISNIYHDFDAGIIARAALSRMSSPGAYQRAGEDGG